MHQLSTKFNSSKISPPNKLKFWNLFRQKNIHVNFHNNKTIKILNFCIKFYFNLSPYCLIKPDSTHCKTTLMSWSIDLIFRLTIKSQPLKFSPNQPLPWTHLTPPLWSWCPAYRSASSTLSCQYNHPCLCQIFLTPLCNRNTFITLFFLNNSYVSLHLTHTHTMCLLSNSNLLHSHYCCKKG